MMASPHNIEVEQCVAWSKPPSGRGRKSIRGFKTVRDNAEKDICIETKKIVLKQHGDDMQHWLTDIHGTSYLELNRDLDFVLPF